MAPKTVGTNSVRRNIDDGFVKKQIFIFLKLNTTENALCDHFALTQTESGDINRVIIITEDFYLVTFSNRDWITLTNMITLHLHFL